MGSRPTIAVGVEAGIEEGPRGDLDPRSTRLAAGAGAWQPSPFQASQPAPRAVTVAGEPGATMPVGRLASIRRKAEIEELR